METYVFRNKFVIPNQSARRRLGARLLILLVLLVVIAKLALDGFALTTVCIPLILAGVLIRPGAPVLEEYALTEVSFPEGGMRILVRDLDRHDRLGRRSETYAIRKGDLQGVRYQADARKLDIVSCGRVTVEGENGGGAEKDYRKEGEACSLSLYLTEEVREPVLQRVQELCREAPQLSVQAPHRNHPEEA